ncbi:hypothetical protein ES707_00117 [subsurface metagenome]
MATKEKILEILNGESGPVNQAMLSEKIGEPISSFTTQLGRMVGQGLIEKNELKEFSLTEEGRAIALREAEIRQSAGVGAIDETLSEESLKTTEYQTFIELGKITGVAPLPLIGQTANHIWRGGDFRDLAWVWKGLTEMGIRPDLAQRWFHSWRSYLHQALPAELAPIMGLAGLEEKIETGKGGPVAKGKRDYIINGSDNPLYVGEGLGDLDYDDAVRLSTVRAAALVRGGTPAQTGQPTTPGSMADEVIKIINAFKETMGPQTKGKSYIVKPGEEGYIVEEVEEGKPTLISTPGRNTNPSPSFLIDSQGNVEEIAPGHPVVIKQAAPPASSPGKTYLVRQTPEGMVTEEFDVGKPIIINAPAPAPGASLPPMLPFPVIGDDGQPVYDKDGKPVYANIEPMMKWMGFQSEQKRADERHQALMGLAKTARENLGDGVAALKAAATEIKGGVKAPAAAQPQLYECGQCHEKFGVQPGEWAKVACPKCQTEYTREEVLGA